MKNAKRLMVVSYVLALALTLGACGGGGSVSGPTPITNPSPSPTATPASFARVVMPVPASESAIPPGTRPQVTVEYGLTGGPYSDLWVVACLSVDGGVTYLLDTCVGKSAQELSGQKTILPGEVDHGKTTNAIVPLVMAGGISRGTTIVRGPATAHTWVW